MTNREAFWVYLRCQLENGVQSLEALSDYVFMWWVFENKDCGAIHVSVNDALNRFWFTQGGRKYGKGIDAVVKWLGAEFDGDIEECRKAWSEPNTEWAVGFIKSFGEMKEAEQ